jgi:hypothetical protein
MAHPDQPPWWKSQGFLSLVAFWGVLGGLSLFILATPERTQQVFRSDAPVGYRFTFENMRLQDHGQDSTTFITAKEATYDRRRAQVSLVAPAIIVQSTAGEERWRATAGHGIADVPRRTDLFPSSLGDIRMMTDVVIADVANDRILTTSGMVWYLAADQVLLSTDRTLIRGRARTATASGFLLGTLDGRQVLVQGSSSADLTSRYRALRQSRQNKPAEGGTER